MIHRVFEFVVITFVVYNVSVPPALEAPSVSAFMTIGFVGFDDDPVDMMSSRITIPSAAARVIAPAGTIFPVPPVSRVNTVAEATVTASAIPIVDESSSW